MYIESIEKRLWSSADNLRANSNYEKDRATIERTFEELIRFIMDLEEEENRAIREGLDEETLAIYDLLRKPDLGKKEIDRLKKVARDLLATLKTEKLRVENWRRKQATRDAVRVTIHDFLYDERTGLPTGLYTDEDVEAKTETVYLHILARYQDAEHNVYAGARL
jgi:type I restriction enzyme R subunit